MLLLTQKHRLRPGEPSVIPEPISGGELRTFPVRIISIKSRISIQKHYRAFPFENATDARNHFPSPTKVLTLAPFFYNRKKKRREKRII